MSEETPRNEAGQFAPAKELYGIEGVEADAGYISRSVAFEKVDTPESVGSDEESLRELARQKWGDQNDEPTKIEVVHLDTGERVAENLAQTVEQAAAIWRTSTIGSALSTRRITLPRSLRMSTPSARRN